MLQGNWMFINLGMCLLLSDQVVFLLYDVSAVGIHLTNEKEKAILDWPTPKRPTDVISFQVLSSFCSHFIKGFNSIITLMINALKKKVFHWTS